MTAAHPDQARLYAIDLLNRVTPDHFDYEDVAIIARLIPLIEGDLADWLEGQLRGTVSRTLIGHRVRYGLYRLPADQPTIQSPPELRAVSSSTTERTSK